MKKVNIFDVEIAALSFPDLEEWLKESFFDSEKRSVSKVNSEFLVRAQKSTDFKGLLQASSLVIPDGIGVLWAAKYLSLPTSKVPVVRVMQALYQMVYSGLALIFNPKYAKNVLPERLSGVEVFYTMLEGAAKNNESVYIFGGRDDVLKKAVLEIEAKYPTIKFSGSRSGYNYSEEEIVKDINNSKAKLLIVALGSPKQENFIHNHLAKLDNVRVAVGEGGSLDYVANIHKRAPKWLQRIGLEWLWRGLTTPNLSGSNHRLRRIWDAVPVFVYMVVKYKLKREEQ